MNPHALVNQEVRYQIDSKTRYAAVHSAIFQNEFCSVCVTSRPLVSTPSTAAEGLDPVERAEDQDLMGHTALAMTAEGVPLGLMAQKIWTRDPAEVGKSRQQLSSICGQGQGCICGGSGPRRDPWRAGRHACGDDCNRASRRGVCRNAEGIL